MTGENLAATNDNHDPDPKRKISRLDANTLIQGLERLRECFEQRLGRLETMARERTAQPVPERSELEHQLQERIREYDEAQRQLEAQLQRHEQEWHAALERLEEDRALLAEAWERLERERLESGTATAPQATSRFHPAERGTTVPVRPRPEAGESVDDQVAHAILKQFQALRNDVRRNARQRGSM